VRPTFQVLEFDGTGAYQCGTQGIDDSGEEQRLIRTVARKGFRFVGDVREAQSSDGFSSLETKPSKSNKTYPLALPDKLHCCLAVPELERRPRAGVPRRRRGIITALSRICWLFVTARNSSFTYKGRAVDVKQVGREQ